MSKLGERIEPIPALTYDWRVAGDPATLVAPPYDLIGPDRQRELYARSEYNIVRLELGRDADRYSAASATLAGWLARGVLKRSAPAIYLYTQSFEVDGRAQRREGLIVRVRLEAFRRGRILPHERTFPAAKEDRLRLLRAIRANTSSIFGLYSGKSAELENLRREVSARPALVDFTDDLGIGNQLRAIESPAEIAIVQRALATPEILIADGHHRYETALNFQRERRQPAAPPEPQPFDYTMMTLASSSDPGLVILPTHRVVRSLDRDAIAKFGERVRGMFDVEQFADAAAMRARLRERGCGSLGVALRGSASLLLLTIRDPKALAAAMPDLPTPVRELDVSILHALVFDRVFALRADEIRRGGNIEYTIDANAALASVRDGSADGAFLMNPPTIGDVERVSEAGATMPEKSTYFFPKLITGLVMNPVDDE